eukprot:12141647-Alexandrium_andersonii.AAC.1
MIILTSPKHAHPQFAVRLTGPVCAAAGAEREQDGESIDEARESSLILAMGPLGHGGAAKAMSYDAHQGCACKHWSTPECRIRIMGWSLARTADAGGNAGGRADANCCEEWGGGESSRQGCW